MPLLAQDEISMQIGNLFVGSRIIQDFDVGWQRLGQFRSDIFFESTAYALCGHLHQVGDSYECGEQTDGVRWNLRLRDRPRYDFQPIFIELRVCAFQDG